MTVRWGMIGCGDVTERKSGPAYYKAAGSQLAGVWARRGEAAHDYASRHPVGRVYDSAEALITSGDIDAVYIATPPDAHVDFALAVARAGKPCCIEKPIANRGADADRLVAAFAAADTPLFVAYYRRTLPRFLKIRDWLAAGAIGPVRHVYWTLMQAPQPRDSEKANWRVDAARAPGGYFDDLASHGLDLFDFLLGPIAAVSGFAIRQHAAYSAPDAFSAAWHHASGATGTAVWNFAARADRESVEIEGAAGRIRFSVFADGPVVLEAGDMRQADDIAHPDPIQLPHVEAMNAELRGAPFAASASAAATGAAAARTAHVMDAIRG